MVNIKNGVTELIGGTPLMALDRFAAACGLEGAHLIGKMEMFNPAGSSKDRVALKMIEDAEKDGRLVPGATIIEPTSGNTGIGLAAVGTARGYRTILTLPDTMSAERRAMLRAYGAELVLTDGKLGMQGAIDRADELARSIEGAVILGQFVNPSNPQAHYETTGPEIWRDTDGRVDVFVCTAGTGGTITGTGRYLKEKDPGVYVIAVEPDTSAVLSGDKPGPHGIQGIGAGFIPEILDTNVYDEVIRITDEEAYEYGRRLAASEGVIAGISSGAALCAAVKAAERPAFAGKNIVVLLPDSGDRYLSTPMFA